MTRWRSLSAAGAVALLAALVGVEPAEAEGASHQQESTVRMRISIEGKTMTVTLEDNGSARDFVSLLPLTTTLEDYASTEKIAYLPRKLNTEDAPSGIDPSVGDVTYYAPWGNLAIFYRDFGYAKGLVKLGVIDSGVEALERPERIRVTMELLEE